MKITLEFTEHLTVDDKGRKARLWKGETEDGVPIIALITAIGVPEPIDPDVQAKILASGLVQREDNFGATYKIQHILGDQAPHGSQ